MAPSPSESPAAELSSPLRVSEGSSLKCAPATTAATRARPQFLEAQPRASRVAALATTRALEPMPSLVARDCRVELAAPTLQRGAAVGDINGVETHCLCCKFGDYSTIFFTQNGGVGAVVTAAGAATSTKMGSRGDDGLADLLARKLSELVDQRIVLTLAVRKLETIADVKALVALFERAR